ncbi:MAG TPA: DUF1294 domain-containing protein [Scandinavium sp.]|jgi:uncharacterized membrane protein YsdA (DUF1294 family)|uniref:DUF1294 domain-containing protein n=1 Tax=Scandinavium sp. TaxID=2830653 RepID=UPI002E32D245|nr:DUF1294 domain-containing protein [Scandinavium sp.]HEX4501929.1 DUF1294 domain-containing protein [Scandinavium sp.]
MYLNRLCYLLLILAAAGSVYLPHPLATWFISANLLTLLIYGVDKLAACKSWRRIPETTLLLFGVVGGWPAAILGQQLFHHKKQKQPFRTYFYTSVVANVLVVVAAYQMVIR